MLAAVSACEPGVFAPADPDEPTDLFYQLIPSGDPDAPLGILLQWTEPSGGRANSYDVYARSSTNEEFGLRATTTSPSFHDASISADQVVSSQQPLAWSPRVAWKSRRDVCVAGQNRPASAPTGVGYPAAPRRRCKSRMASPR